MDTTYGHQFWTPLAERRDWKERMLSLASQRFSGLRGYFGANWLGNLDSNQD